MITNKETRENKEYTVKEIVGYKFINNKLYFKLVYEGYENEFYWDLASIVNQDHIRQYLYNHEASDRVYNALNMTREEIHIDPPNIPIKTEITEEQVTHPHKKKAKIDKYNYIKKKKIRLFIQPNKSNEQSEKNTNKKSRNVRSGITQDNVSYIPYNAGFIIKRIIAERNINEEIEYMAEFTEKHTLHEWLNKEEANNPQAISQYYEEQKVKEAEQFDNKVDYSNLELDTKNIIEVPTKRIVSIIDYKRTTKGNYGKVLFEDKSVCFVPSTFLRKRCPILLIKYFESLY